MTMTRRAGSRAQADHITVMYRSASGHEVLALDQLSFAIEPGEWCVFAGPSGSGKSSLLYCLGGLLTPTSGRLDVAGHRLDQLSRADLARYRRSIVGFVFQSFNLLPHLQAWENVALPLIATGVHPALRRERALTLLSEVGLAARGSHRPAELSAGEQQRVAVARAMANEPGLLLADEPTGNLDAKNASGILDLLSALMARGTTIICASHDEGVTARANRVLELRHGVLADHESAADRGIRAFA
jgi:putative ABC transport system ATP-binding protein